MSQTIQLSTQHCLTGGEVFLPLETTEAGLSSEEARLRLATHGHNALPEPARRSAVLRFLAHFYNVLIYALTGSAVITATLQHWVDTGVILAVVLANAVIGFIQEGRAEQAMNAIRGMLAPRSTVLRDGVRRSVDAVELEPGDIVLVEAGDRVRDLRLLEARALKVEEAILTGESVPVEKATAPATADAVLGDRTSMLFCGAQIAAGTGRGVVTTTGGATEIGRIDGMLCWVQTMTTPLVHRRHWRASHRRDVADARTQHWCRRPCHGRLRPQPHARLRTWWRHERHLRDLKLPALISH